MEVRSNSEQCGNDAAAAASVTTSINQSMESNESVDTKRSAIEMDPSITTVNEETRQPLTRDESEYRDKDFVTICSFVFFFFFSLF